MDDSSTALPSRFQIGDVVVVGGHRGSVTAVTFTVIDGVGKVQYDVETRSGMRYRLNSEFVTPPLQVVTNG